MTADAVTCFIGSSREGLGYAKVLAAHLEEAHNTTCEVWDDAFALGQTTVEGLEDVLARHSFAVLIATADDLATARGKTELSPRDNVILEFGLFVGRLGRDRAFLLVEDNNVKLPSDLLGVTLGFFQARKTAKARKNSMRGPASKVAAQIGKLGPLETPSDPTLTNDLLMSASSLVANLRTHRKAKIAAGQRDAWAKAVLAEALDPFLARADDAYAAWLQPGERKVLQITQAVNLQEGEWEKHEWKEGEGLLGKVWETGKPLSVDGRRPHKWFVSRPGCENESYLCVPIKGPGDREGVLAVGSDEGFDVRAGDLALLGVYSALLAFAAPL